MAEPKLKCAYCKKTVTRGQYRREGDEIYCKACHALGVYKPEAIEGEIIDALPVKKKLGMNPLEEAILMSPEIERDRKLAKLNEFQTLAELNQEIAKAQELTAALAKHADILHVPMIDGFNNIILDELTSTEGEEGLRETIRYMLAEHDVKGLRMLLAGMKDLNELREMWLSAFDDSRQLNKPKVKIQAVFQNNGNVGVNVETS